MYCYKCGKEIADETDVCPHCGADVPSKASKNENRESAKGVPMNECAIAGFVLAFIMPMFGLVFSVIGLLRIKKCAGNGKWLSVAGVIVSLVSYLLFFVLIRYILPYIYQLIQYLYKLKSA